VRRHQKRNGPLLFYSLYVITCNEDISIFPPPNSVGNLSPAMGARDHVGIGLSYRPASLCSLAINSRLGSWNRFLALWRDLCFRLRYVLHAEVKFLVPDRGDIVKSGIGLSYRSASLCNLYPPSHRLRI
jgi:hypothetical protein